MKIKRFFDIFIFILFLPLFLLEILFILLYKAIISPAIPHSCRFVPCCSTYFLQALKEYGVFVGSFMGIKRILRCNPLNKGGLDPVKPNIKGKIKWVL